jgi:tRNA (cmo5U34)-methyltransferase
MPGEEWQEPTRAEGWPSVRARLPRLSEAESVLVEDVLPDSLSRVLDLGMGNGRLIGLLRTRWPSARAVGLDFSPPLLEAARQRFAGTDGIRVAAHDLMEPLPAAVGSFDAVVSGLAIHHLPHARKRSLFGEVFAMLEPGGVFANLDVVESPTPELHERAQAAFGFGPDEQDSSDQPAPLHAQLRWLEDAGFNHVDCFWKWLDLALIAGTKPPLPPDPRANQST